MTPMELQQCYYGRSTGGHARGYSRAGRDLWITPGPCGGTRAGTARPYPRAMPPRLEAARGDITVETVDAVVNAANSALAPGGGVCGAIFAAAGPELDRACRVLPGCATGDAVATPGFGLPARFVIHAVDPGRDGRKGDAAGADLV